MTKYKDVLESNEFMLLQEITSILSSSLNLQDSIGEIFELLHSRFGFTKSILSLHDKRTDMFKIKVSYGIQPKEIESSLYKQWTHITEKALELKTSLIVSHLQDQPIEFINFINEDLDLLTKDSFICMPLILENEKFGSLSLDLPFYEKDKLETLVKVLLIVCLMIAQEVRLKRLLDQEKEVLRRENIKLKDELERKYNIHNMIGNSSAMVDVYEKLKQVASANATVLIRGESGTGKELVAHAVHQLSEFKEGPFIKVNCGALPETLIESELFGHEKGSFTDAYDLKIGKIEAANGGTLFLDEIAELSTQMQVKLLRFLQDKEISRVGGVDSIKVNVRVVTATNRDLEKGLEDKSIREDFYYRLNVFPIHIPSLRERKTDILLLAEHFLEKYSAANNKNISRIAASVIDIFYSYNWPGNVRELENCIERSVIMCNSDTLQPTHLPSTLHTPGSDLLVQSQEKSSFKDLVMLFEKKVILDSLHKTRGNVTKSARELETTTRILGYKIKQLNIDVDEVKVN